MRSLSNTPSIAFYAAKDKIERFFQGFRDRFLVQHIEFETLDELNNKTQDWIENDYNSQPHSGIQMIPIYRFNLDRNRIKFLTDDEFTEEVFFMGNCSPLPRYSSFQHDFGRNPYL